MRALLSALARDRIVKKRLPHDLGGGTVFCSPDALLSMWKPGWRSHQAANLFAWARRYVKTGDVVWDIGANQGLFTFAAAAMSGAAGRVVAFEPDPFLFGLLYRSSRAQSRARIDVLPVAVGGNSGVATFCVASKDRALNHLASVPGNPHTRGDRDRLAVVSVTLDFVAQHLPAPNLIKVDVEGAELGLLEHAGSLMLNGARPTWIIEVAAENANPIADILRTARYRMFDANAPGQEIDRPAWNTLAVPEEKL